jgi:hypothetical protein
LCEVQENVTTAIRPSDVVIFEDAAARFDGKVPVMKKFGALHIALFSSLAMIIAAAYLIIKDSQSASETTVLWVFGLLGVFSLSMVLFVFGIDTPYGKISRFVRYQDGMFYFDFMYPSLSPATGKVRWRTISNEELGIQSDGAYSFYEQKMKQNPVLWLQYMFYRDQAYDWKQQLDSIEKPPKVFKDNLKWCVNRAEKYYDLFMAADESSKSE